MGFVLINYPLTWRDGKTLKQNPSHFIFTKKKRNTHPPPVFTNKKKQLLLAVALKQYPPNQDAEWTWLNRIPTSPSSISRGLVLCFRQKKNTGLPKNSFFPIDLFRCIYFVSFFFTSLKTIQTPPKRLEKISFGPPKPTIQTNTTRENLSRYDWMI